MNIALVILNWNGKKLLQTFLPNVVKYSRQATVYVVDNASTDDSVDYIRDYFPEVAIIQNKKNEGYAKGYNTALSQINADVYALLNSDVGVTKNWLKPIIDFYKTNKEACILQPKILDHQNKSTFEYAGAAGGYIDKYGYSYCKGRVFAHLEKDNDQYDSSAIHWASGAAFFIKASAFKALNGFDEDYFAHYEEIDLCWRARNKGHKVYSVLESTVYHVGGATLKNASPFKTYLNFRNSLFTLVKNLPSKKLFAIVFTRMLLDGLAGIRFLILWQPTHFGSILKAHGSFYKYLAKMYAKREKHQTKNYYSTQSIVWDYFVSQKRVFIKK